MALVTGRGGGGMIANRRLSRSWLGRYSFFLVVLMRRIHQSKAPGAFTLCSKCCGGQGQRVAVLHTSSSHPVIRGFPLITARSAPRFLCHATWSPSHRAGSGRL